MRLAASLAFSCSRGPAFGWHAALAIVLVASEAGAQWQAPPPPPVAPPAIMPFGPPMPVASPPTPAQMETIRNLDWAKSQDAGRRLEWVWLDVNGGFEQLGMQTFKGGDSFTGGLIKTSSSGGAVGAGVGARLLFFTFLLRGRIGVFDSGELYRIGPELGFHIPIGNLEPHVSLGAGYGAVGNLHDTVGGAAASSLSLRGYYTRVGVGLDYYVAPVFSLGIGFTSELLGLFRPALTAAEVSVLQSKLPTGRAISGDLTTTGTGLGGTVAVTGVLGLHF